MSSNDQSAQASELASKIQQFFSYQIENGNLSDASKESLTVATECIEQAFKIQKKPASNELLDIYNSHKNPRQPSASTSLNDALGGNPAALLQNLASTFLGSGILGGANNPAAGAADSATSTTTSSDTASAPPPSAPKSRKNATPAEKMAAESFKNQGNDYMKQNMHKEALNCYSQAIAIDDNNAIYYSNRAAAHSKLGDHKAAMNDCREAIEIDPTYSKAYGRLGLAYASLEDHQKAKDAYLKAVELDPANESYKNNLKIAEERLAELAASGTSAAAGSEGISGLLGGQGNMANILRNMMSNPEVMQMALRSLQDPRMQNLLGLGGQQQQ